MTETATLPQPPAREVAPPVTSTEETRLALDWFKDYCARNNLKSLGHQASVLGYSASTLSRLLADEYGAAPTNFLARVDGLKRRVEAGATVTHAKFVPNRNTRKIAFALDFIRASGGMGHIYGHSGVSKTEGLKAWLRTERNSDSAALVNFSGIGGVVHLLAATAEAIGAKSKGSAAQVFDNILGKLPRGFMLIYDEAGLLLKGVGVVEAIRRLHDLRGCPIMLCSTDRFHERLVQMQYDFEQLLGRCEPFPLAARFPDREVDTLVRTVIESPNDSTLEIARRIANAVKPEGDTMRGRLRSLTGLLALASRIAGRGNVVTSTHFAKALKIRQTAGATDEDMEESR